MQEQIYQIRFIGHCGEYISESTARFWRNKDPRLFRRTQTAIDRLVASPYDAAGSHLLKWDLAGLRAADLIRGWRLIFKVCQECHQNNLEQPHPLDCCIGDVEVDELTINILGISDHYA